MSATNQNRQWSRWLLFTAIYVLTPLALLSVQTTFSLPALWIVAAASLPFTFRMPRISPCAWRLHIGGILLRAMLFAVLVAVLALIFAPGSFFALPRAYPRRWALIVLIYPLISVIPQSLVYRTLFFRHFAPLFRARGVGLTISALCFSLAHVAFRNPLLLLLCLLGGLLFNTTYLRTRSLLLSVIEHTLFGLVLFTVGGHELLLGGTQDIVARIAIFSP